MIGTQVGKYRVTAFLGEGGAGEIYAAEHELIGRKAAVKFLRPEASREKGTISRFIEEARAVNGIRHPNIVDITDFGEIEDRHYLIMELLEGETVADRLERKGAFSELDAADIGQQVASALAAAHEAGFVHRDIKPENLFLTSHPDRPRFVKVLDFGIAKLLKAGGGGATPRHTAPGSVVGTPIYMSPEQCLGKENTDGRSDIYSLGVVLYEMILGDPPFDDPVLGKLIMAHCRREPRPPKELNDKISGLMNRTILQALQKKPEDRFQTADELRKRLRVLALQEGTSAGEAEEAAEGDDAAAGQRIVQNKLELVTPTKRLLKEMKEGRRPRARRPSHTRRQSGASIELKSKRVAGKLTSIVRERIAQNKFVLPAMPKVVVDCLTKLSDPNHNFEDLAAIINDDPLVVTQVLKLANSAAFGGMPQAKSLPHALTRLGDRYLKAVLLELSARRIFESRNPRIRRAFYGIWDHARATAQIARGIGDALEGLPDKDLIYLSGLLHDVGKPMVAGLLLEAEKLLGWGDRRFMNDEIWIQVVNECHREVAIPVAEAWNLPREIPDIIQRCGSYDEENPRCLLNCVTLANAAAKRDAPYPGAADVEDVMVQIFTGCELMDLEQEKLDEIVAGI